MFNLISCQDYCYRWSLWRDWRQEQKWVSLCMLIIVFGFSFYFPPFDLCLFNSGTKYLIMINIGNVKCVFLVHIYDLGENQHWDALPNMIMTRVLFVALWSICKHSVYFEKKCNVWDTSFEDHFNAFLTVLSMVKG